MLNNIIRRICNFYNKKLERDLMLTGDDISEYCKKYKIYFLISVTSISLIILGSIYIYHDLIFTSLIPSLLLLSPLLREKIAKDEFLKALEKEVPIFSAYLYANSLLGKSLYQSILNLKDSKILKGISKEAMLLEKNVRMRGLTSTTAILERSRLHRKDALGRIYSEFIDTELVGVSTNQRAKQSLEKVMGEMKQNLNSYVQRSVDLSEVMFSFFLLFPIMLTSFQLAFDKSINLVQVITPLISSPVFYLIISSFQPSSDYIFSFSKKVILGVAGVLVISSILLLKYLGPSLTLMVAVLELSIVFYLQLRVADSLTSKLPAILDKISDYSRVGYGLRSSLQRVINSENIDLRTKKYLIEFLKNLDNEREMTTPSWTFNATLDLLRRIDTLGYVDTKVFSELSAIIQEMLNMRSSMQSNLQLFTVISAITPILFHFTLFSFSFMASDKYVLNQLVNVYTIVIEILYSKISKLTLFNFPLVLVTTVISIILSFFSLPL
ncbi:membrane pilin protein UpsF [Sulfuracidifex tepidarius]